MDVPDNIELFARGELQGPAWAWTAMSATSLGWSPGVDPVRARPPYLLLQSKIWRPPALSGRFISLGLAPVKILLTRVRGWGVIEPKSVNE